MALLSGGSTVATCVDTDRSDTMNSVVVEAAVEVKRSPEDVFG